jgi:hypothetical protein
VKTPTAFLNPAQGKAGRAAALVQRTYPISFFFRFGAPQARQTGRKKKIIFGP